VLDAGTKLRIQCGAPRLAEIDNSESLPDENGPKLKWFKNGKPFVAKGNNNRVTKIG